MAYFNGPKIEPCCTPIVILACCEFMLSTTVYCRQLENNSLTSA